MWAIILIVIGIVMTVGDMAVIDRIWRKEIISNHHITVEYRTTLRKLPLFYTVAPVIGFLTFLIGLVWGVILLVQFLLMQFML